MIGERYADFGPTLARGSSSDPAYERYERLPQVDMGAIVENKRPSRVLQTTLVIQAQRDDRHASNMPHRTNSGRVPYAKIPCPAPNARASSQSQAQTEAASCTAGGSAKRRLSLHLWL